MHIELDDQETRAFRRVIEFQKEHPGEWMIEHSNVFSNLDIELYDRLAFYNLISGEMFRPDENSSRNIRRWKAHDKSHLLLWSIEATRKSKQQPLTLSIYQCLQGLEYMTKAEAEFETLDKVGKRLLLIGNTLVTEINEMKKVNARVIFESEYNFSDDGEVFNVISGLWKYYDEAELDSLRVEHGYNDETGEYEEDETDELT